MLPKPIAPLPARMPIAFWEIISYALRAKIECDLPAWERNEFRQWLVTIATLG
jgi:hypothetical protein